MPDPFCDMCDGTGKVQPEPEEVRDCICVITNKNDGDDTL